MESQDNKKQQQKHSKKHSKKKKEKTKKKLNNKNQKVIDVQTFAVDDGSIVKVKKKKIYKKRSGTKVLVRIIKNHCNAAGVIVKTETIAVDNVPVEESLETTPTEEILEITPTEESLNTTLTEEVAIFPSQIDPLNLSVEGDENLGGENALVAWCLYRIVDCSE